MIHVCQRPLEDIGFLGSRMGLKPSALRCRSTSTFIYAHSRLTHSFDVVRPVWAARGVVQRDKRCPIRRLRGSCCGGDVRGRSRPCGVDGRHPVVAGASRRQPGVRMGGGGISRVRRQVHPSGSVPRHLDPVSRDGHSTIVAWRTPRQVHPGLPVLRRRQTLRRPRAVVP